MKSTFQKVLYTLLILSVMVFKADAQIAMKQLLSKGLGSYKKLQFTTAARLLEQYISKMDSTDFEITRDLDKDDLSIMIADCYWRQRDYVKSKFWYNTIPESLVAVNEIVRLRKGELLAMQENYGLAAQYLASVRGYTPKASGYAHVARMSRDSGDWKLAYLRMNSKEYREFSPLLIENRLYWSTNERKTEFLPKFFGWDGFRYAHVLHLNDTSYAPITSMPQKYTLETPALKSALASTLAKHFAGSDNSLLSLPKVFSSKKMQNRKYVLKEAESLGGVKKMKYNVAHTSYSAVTNKIYLSVNSPQPVGQEKVRLLTIMEGDFDKEDVTNKKILNLGLNGYSTMHPAIHPNGNLLVFSADFPGGRGGYDLYYTVKDEAGTWSLPIALTAINTIGNEVFARFSESGDLYFSSDGMVGVGGLDIYRALIDVNLAKTTIEHLPIPVNSPYDDFGWTETADMSIGYFTSDRYGSDDIFSFEFKPLNVKLSGSALKNIDGLRTAGVKVTLLEIMEDGKEVVVKVDTTDNVGNYSFYVRPNRQYKLLYEYDGYSEGVQTVSTSVGKAIDMDIVSVGKPRAKPGEADSKIARLETNNIYAGNQNAIIDQGVQRPDLENWIKGALMTYIVHHDFDKVTIIKKDQHIIKDVQKLLKANPGYSLRVVSATDCMGSEEYNNILSQNRSEFVGSLFVRKVRNSISKYWVGKRQLLIPCDTYEFNVARQLENRYSYLIVVKND
jgi:outer membrane protein OmpA-like peptidoglycan-associated protein